MAEGSKAQRSWISKVGSAPSSMSSSTPALPARPVSTPPLPTSTWRARRAGAAATTVASPMRRRWGSHLDRVINVYPGWERLAGLAAGHAKLLFGLAPPRGAAHHHRDESDAPSTEKAGARVLPLGMRSSGSPARLVSHLTSRKRRPRVESRGLSPRMNQSRGVTKLPRGFRWKASSRDDDQS